MNQKETIVNIDEAAILTKKEKKAIYMKANYAANREKRKAQQKDYNLFQHISHPHLLNCCLFFVLFHIHLY